MLQAGVTRSTVGPLRYMAPESLSSRVYSPASDVYMLAVTVWAVLAREEPFKEHDNVQAAAQVRAVVWRCLLQDRGG